MKIRLIWVGKTKEQHILEGIIKYQKFLRRYADVSISEIKEEKGSNVQRVVEREGERISRLQVPYILLDEKGKGLTSFDFAKLIGNHASPVNFVVGGAYGVSDAVKEKADLRIALSRMTFTHEMSRLILMEQIYRAFTILNNRDYHH